MENTWLKHFVGKRKDILNQYNYRSMKKFRFLVMAFTLLFAISIPTQVVAQNKKLIKKAENGSGEAQALLSTYYFKGIEGFDRDIEQNGRVTKIN